MKKSFLLGIDRFLSGKFLKQLAVAFIPFLSVLIVVSLVYIFNNKRDGSIGEKVAQAFVDMTNPETVRDSVYYSTQLIPKQIEQSVTEIEENYHKPSFGTVIGLVVVYFLGAVFFTGLLIATFTNIWRARAEKFRRGKVDYHFSGHIVFLGYNSLVPGLIQKICEERDDNIKEVRIVVGVESNASVVNDKIKNRLYNDYRNRVVVLQADSCNMEDLERLRVSFAKEVYIIGEHDDAYNLKCYRAIYEVYLCEKSPKAKMPQCYVCLQSQATLTLFRTYASAGDLGIDFTNFHSFSFYDEWARMLLTKTVKEKMKIKGTKTKRNWPGYEHLQDHFIIAGMTEMGIALARKATLLCQKPDGKPTIITLIDDEASKKARDFIIQHQDLFDRIPYRIQTKTSNYKHIPTESFNNDIFTIFEFIDGDLFDNTIRQEISDSTNNTQQTITLAICYDDPQQNIVSGLNLPNNYYGDDSNACVWLYQPTLGDLGKYLKSERYTNFSTFGMSGYELDIRNTDCVDNAKLINHFFRHKDDKDKDGNDKKIEFTNKVLIKTEWESTDIHRRWICIRHAEFIPILTQYMDYIPNSKMIELERKRSTTDIFLFGEEDLYSQQNIFPKYMEYLHKILHQEY